jgi:hypothetical protein
MQRYRFTFAEYERGGRVYLMKRTGQAMAMEGHTAQHAAQRMARGFKELGQEATVHPDGPTVYPFGADESEFCWRPIGEAEPVR